jgi:carbon starvation protein
MVFLLFMTTWAMIGNLRTYLRESELLLLVVGAAIFVLEVWLLLEAVSALRRAIARRREAIAPASALGQGD